MHDPFAEILAQVHDIIFTEHIWINFLENKACLDF